MGSSLKTLRRYSCLWPKRISKAGNKVPETKLVIINLQYTSKDQNAVLKINGKCDLVMQLVMQKLNIDVPVYDWSHDALHHLAVPFTLEERSNLKRNLIFDTRPAIQPSMSPSSSSMKRSLQDDSKSPNIFVAEMTDDPEKKKLKMRIRAVNSGNPASNTNESSSSHDGLVAGDTPVTEYSKPEKDSAVFEHVVKPLDYVLPGWIAKSIGSTRTKRYRRKRHGNKGRKHSSVLLTHNNSRDALIEDEVSNLDVVSAIKTETLSPETAV